MEKAKTTNEIGNDQSFLDMVDWFNRWLSDPITDREKVLLGEAVDYLATNKVKRYNPEKFGSTINEARQKEAENAEI